MTSHIYRYQRVEVHPITLKLSRKGHPWVIKDQYTEKFPTNYLLIAKNKSNDEFLFLHDPKHPKIKGRVWSHRPPFSERAKNFNREFKERITDALKKREEVMTSGERENIILIFGESDFLPGLEVILLKNHILMRYYAHYWNAFEQLLMKYLRQALAQYFGQTRFIFWKQDRVQKNAPIMALEKSRSASKYTTVINEAGVNYQVDFKDPDLGLYTDMAGIRHREAALFESSKSVLNLYSYTGAFSLYASKKGAQRVTSVDLSKQYLDWMKQNLELNGDIDADSHEILNLSVDDALKKVILDDREYDLIICDPPSFSNDKKKSEASISKYERYLQMFDQILSDNGKMMIFINTHSISMKKFEAKMSEYIKGSNFKIERSIRPSIDCPKLQGFPESHQVKGLLISRK